MSFRLRRGQTKRDQRIAGPRPAGRVQRTARTRVHAQTEQIQIDLSTGQPYADQDSRAPKARNAVDAGGIKMAYRKAEPDGASNDLPPVLLLHGIASHSFCYRDLMRLLAEQGYTVYAPDWPGHGASDKPTSGFAYDEAAYVKALDGFIEAVGLQDQPLNVLTHGFVLGQYGMLWALQHSDAVVKLMVMNVPLGKKAQLRPELAKYKAAMPFMRPKADAKVAGDLYNASGLAYVIQYDDAQVYDLPFQEEPAANQAIAQTMNALDWKQLLSKVDESYCSWRVPTAVLYGNQDPFLNVRDAVDFLDSKRTSMQLASVEGKLGHMPQEDFAEAVGPLLANFFAGEDITVRGTKKFRKSDFEDAGSSEGNTGDFFD